jgi:hypothetical protein
MFGFLFRLISIALVAAVSAVGGLVVADTIAMWLRAPRAPVTKGLGGLVVFAAAASLLSLSVDPSLWVVRLFSAAAVVAAGAAGSDALKHDYLLEPLQLALGWITLEILYVMFFA